ncbi:MAG: stage II sporulation protein M [archaeon]
MVLESLVTRKEALTHPFVILVISVLICSVSLWASYLIFPRSASMLAIAFVTIALAPLFHTIFRSEEEKEAERRGYAALFLSRHFSIIKVYAFFFIGIILAYAFWYSIATPETGAAMFSEQEATLAGINQLKANLTGNFSLQRSACGLEPFCWFEVIFVNNAFFVMVPMLLFSFVYGAGAVFLLGWNASVIGVLIGKDIVQYSASHGGLTALGMAANRALSIVPHGIFEALGYFVGAIAGGIIGAAVSKKRHLRGETGLITKDVIVMILYAFGLLAIGALIEAYAIVSG